MDLTAHGNGSTCGLWSFTSSSAWPEFPPPSWSAGRAHPAMARRHTAPLRADPDLQTQPEHKHNRPGEWQAPLQSSTSPYWEVVELQTPLPAKTWQGGQQVESMLRGQDINLEVYPVDIDSCLSRSSTLVFFSFLCALLPFLMPATLVTISTRS